MTKETKEQSKTPIKHVSMRMPISLYGRVKQYQYFLQETGTKITLIEACEMLMDKALNRFEMNRELAVRRKINQELKAKLTEKKTS